MILLSPQPNKYRNIWFYKGSSWKKEDPLSIIPGTGLYLHFGTKGYIIYLKGSWYFEKI